MAHGSWLKANRRADPHTGQQLAAASNPHQAGFAVNLERSAPIWN